MGDKTAALPMRGCRRGNRDTIKSEQELSQPSIVYGCVHSFLFRISYSKLKRGKMWISRAFSLKPYRLIAHIVSLKGLLVETPPPVVCNLPFEKESITIGSCSWFPYKSGNYCMSEVGQLKTVQCLPNAGESKLHQSSNSLALLALLPHGGCKVYKL